MAFFKLIPKRIPRVSRQNLWISGAVLFLELLNIYLAFHSFGAHPHFAAKVALSSILFFSFIGVCFSIGGAFGFTFLIIYFFWQLFLAVSLWQIGSLPFWYFIATATTQEAKLFLPVVYIGLAISLLVGFLERRVFKFRPLTLLISSVIFFSCFTAEDDVALLNRNTRVDRGGQDFNQAADYQRSIKIPFLHIKDYKNFIYDLTHPHIQDEHYAYHLMRDDPTPLTALYATYTLLFARPEPPLNAVNLKMPAHVSKQPTLKPAKHIIIILGESSAPSRYGIYGYSKKTTPNLQRLLDEKKICKVDKAHSAAPITRFALLPSLSFWSPDNVDDWKSTENLLSLAERERYATYFISAQQELSTYAGSNGLLARMGNHVFTQDICSHCQVLNPRKVVIKKDDDLRAAFIGALDDTPDKKLIILHLYGSHTDYRRRVTGYERTHFPDFSTYDQSIAHTDRLIGAVMKRAEAKWGDDFTMVYFSDHGEEVSESDLNLAGHGLMKNRRQYEIPYLSNNPQVCNLAESLRSDNGMYSTRLNIYPLISLLGYGSTKEALDKLKKNDVVLHTDEKIYRWEDVPR